MSYTDTELQQRDLGLMEERGMPRREAQETYQCSCGMTLSHGIGAGDLRCHDAMYHGVCEMCRVQGHRWCDGCGYPQCLCKCITVAYIEYGEQYRREQQRALLRRQVRLMRLAKRWLHRKAPRWQRRRQVRRALIERNARRYYHAL